MKLCQATSEAGLTQFWRHIPVCHKTGGALAAFQNSLNETGDIALLAGAQICSDILAGQWVPTTFAALDKGWNPTRFATMAQGPTVVNQIRDNQRAQALLEVHNPTGDRLIEMILTPEAAHVSKTTQQLDYKILAYDSGMGDILGRTCDMYLDWHTQVWQNKDTMIQCTCQNYYHIEQEACARVDLALSNAWTIGMQALLNGPVPTAAVPRPVRIDPPYRRVLECLQGLTLSTLIDLPPGLFQNPEELPTGRPPAGPPAVPPPGRQDVPDNRRPVRDEANHNPRLRAAWTEAGHAGLFRVGQR